MQLISTHICKASNLGVHGNLFGGTMLAWLDEAGAAYACQFCDTPRMVTIKMAETRFQKPVRVGHLIKIYGEIVNIGTTSVTVLLEARRHSVYNGTQRTVCTTELTFVRVDGDGEAIPVGEKVQNKFLQHKETQDE
tara:strand:+ start:2020 stop:2427 length:408 start_codon:yes stop_codon:yes gene_type:complete